MDVGFDVTFLNAVPLIISHMNGYRFLKINFTELTPGFETGW